MRWIDSVKEATNINIGRRWKAVEDTIVTSDCTWGHKKLKKYIND